MPRRNLLTAPRPPLLPVVDRTRDDPLRGILLILLAMVSFSGSDVIAKYLSAGLPAVEIAWMRWAGFVVLMAPFIAGSRGAVLRSSRPILQVARTFGLLGSATFFILGLHYLPLATAASIAFAAPLMVTALSIPLLGETIGIRRWAAVAVGLVGVVVVIRPGGDGFGLLAVLPLLSALSWAFGIIATRKLGSTEKPATTMCYSALVGFAVLSCIVPFHWTKPSVTEIALSGVMAIASTSAQFLTVQAYRYATASVLAPISYTQLIWSGLLGYLVFDNVPDAMTFVGIGIIVASGVYTAHRERVAYRGRRLTTPPGGGEERPQGG